ncbi:TonB-dependent receptor [Novosphingobium sp.]|uniref:TonB-dependent receptor n=1 Tax=Novosphingobium sp. TaxID=1874826 RepID=UPI003D109D65
MKSVCSRQALLLCCSVVALAMPALTHAATPGATGAAVPAAGDVPPATATQVDPAVSINEIIVTATRQSKRLQDVAMTVNVATGEQLDKYKIFDIKDVDQLAPGLELTNTTGRNNTTTLRGVTFDPDQGTAPAVQVYINEIPTDAQTAYTAIYDVQQIEVLRGPQGLLRGLSAPAGSITITTRRPSFDKIEGYAEATGTDRAGYNAQLGVSIPINDKLAIRFAGLLDGNRNNNVRDINRNGQRSQSRTESERVTLGWKPTDTVTAYLTYQHLYADNVQFQQVVGSGANPYGVYETEFGTPVSFLPAAYGGHPFTPDTTVRSGPPLKASDYAAVADGEFRNVNNTHIVNLNVAADLGPATLSFVGAHQFSKLTINRDLDDTNALPGYVEYSNVITPYIVNTAEVRLSSNNREGLGWGLGAFYTKETGVTTVAQDSSQFWYPVAPGTPVNLPYAAIGVPLAGFTPFTLSNTLGIATLVNVPVNTQTWSFNGNVRYKSGGLTIEGGLRYSLLRIVQTTQLTLSGAVTQGPYEIIPAALQRNDHNPLTGGADISYALMSTLNVYAAYGHSYRSGSTGVSVPAGISNDLIQTKPEQTDSFEVGFKGSAVDHRINFSISTYYQTLSNYLSLFPNIYYDAPAAQPATGFFQFNYNGNASIKGIEAAIDNRVTSNWDAGISASYNHARYKNALLPCNDFAGTGTPNQNGAPAVTGGGNVSFCRSNGPLAEVPDFSLTANTEIRFPMGAYTPFVRALFTYRPSFYSERVQYQYQDRELLNLFAGVRIQDSRWEFDVFARNLLNQQRITNTTLGQGTVNALLGGTFNSGYRAVNVMNPREFGATLKFKW